MIIQSHIFIAKRISKKLEKKFNHNHFYVGSVAPDILYQHKKRKHEFRYAFPYVIEEIAYLEGITDINLISYKMGIISHYLADFFCKAHNCERLLNNLWEHFQYESLLHKVLIASKNEQQPQIELLNVEAYIKEKYENYLQENPSVVVDILYSLEVCRNVSSYILDQVNDNLFKETA
ncbi:MAG: zinc dependent phospholipase C family protein [Peptococcaceae bacterium]